MQNVTTDAASFILGGKIRNRTNTHKHANNNQYIGYWTVSSKLLGFCFLFFPYFFVSVSCARLLAISSTVERTLIYRIVYQSPAYWHVGITSLY